MKPHFGQSDAAMNKLAGCNSFPNNNKPADLARRDIPCSCIPCKHYESSLDEVPCKYCRDHAKFEERGFDPVKERDAAYDLGYKDAQQEHMKAQGYYGHENGCDCAVCEDMHNRDLQRKIVDAEWNKLLDDNKRLTVLLDAERKNVVYAQQKWAEAEERVEKWKAFYDSSVESHVKYYSALKVIAHMGISGLSWQHDYEKCVNIAKEALEI
jgi:hypothetical protein